MKSKTSTNQQNGIPTGKALEEFNRRRSECLQRLHRINQLEEPLSNLGFLTGCALLAEAIYTAGRGGQTGYEDTNLLGLMEEAKEAFVNDKAQPNQF